MSIALMTLAWKTALPASQKMALLAMCDWANDEGGSLHPSISRVAERVSCSERQAQRILHALIEAGWMAVVGNQNGGAPGQARRYQINVKKLETGDTGVTGDKLTRVTPMSQTGDICDTRRVTFATKTGDTHVTLTTIEPSIEPSGNHHTRAQAPDVSDVPPDVLRDYIATRKTKLTQTAVDGLRREAAKAGVSLAQVMGLCCVRGWKGFKADWVRNREAGPGGGHSHLNRQEAIEARNRAVGEEWLRQEGFSV